MSDSSAILVGNLTRDPELRYSAGGAGVLSGGIAVNKRKQVNGEWTEEVNFFNFVAFGTLAENFAASFNKGTRVVLVGEWTQRSYEDKEGEKKSVVEFKVDSGGPDLRWATASVSRTEKGAGGDKPARSQKPAQRRADPVYGDEEPF